MPPIPKVGEHVFSFGDHPTEPHCFVWRDADPVQLTEYKAARQVMSASRTSEALTKEQSIENEIARVSFVVDRIVGVRNWDIDGPSGEVSRLEWPRDRDAVVASFQMMPPGLKSLFIETVMVAHFPNDIRAYGNAAKVAVYPN